MEKYVSNSLYHNARKVRTGYHVAYLMIYVSLGRAKHFSESVLNITRNQEQYRPISDRVRFVCWTYVLTRKHTLQRGHVRYDLVTVTISSLDYIFFNSSLLTSSNTNGPVVCIHLYWSASCFSAILKCDVKIGVDQFPCGCKKRWRHRLAIDLAAAVYD